MATPHENLQKLKELRSRVSDRVDEFKEWVRQTSPNSQLGKFFRNELLKEEALRSELDKVIRALEENGLDPQKAWEQIAK
jgi:ribosomal protein L16 Arg81 hydroxylase